MKTPLSRFPLRLRLHLRSCLRLSAAIVVVACAAPSVLTAQEPSKRIESRTTYAKAYGETKGAVSVDAAKDLPRYPSVPPAQAIATFQVKKGFALEFAAHEPQVLDPVALSFDEHGRMYVCEMIDYSEMRDATPHLGRISRLEDRDGDGFFEHGTVFADNLAWPTGLIFASGGVFVIATPDIIFLKDNDGDGRADLREVVFTGFGTGLKILNVQGMANCPQWALDNRIHLQAGGGNRGKVKCLKRPDLPELELGGRDFWFDPRTFEFGLEAGGGQFGMSYDDWGRRFVCSNSDHLQAFIYEDRYRARNPLADMPSPRQSIAVDGGAAEVFRISPDEPWRIIRTRWRVAGVVKGAVEGGGRVSGYFTGATGTTVYRGDAYGPGFSGNTFSGDAGGQLMHRKIISPEGASLSGQRPEDEHGFEFLASRDTWVRLVNFANAPDGCLYACDMYREVIEHPWSIPDEIKKHLDLNSGSNLGRVYRIAPLRSDWERRKGNAAAVGGTVPADMSTAELVALLAHPNGWHRDCASRLLHERNDASAVPLLKALASTSPDPLARLHALWSLQGFGALTRDVVLPRLKDGSPRVREHAIRLCEMLLGKDLGNDEAVAALAPLAGDDDVRVVFQLALTLGDLQSPAVRTTGASGERDALLDAFLTILHRHPADAWITAAVLSSARLREHPSWLYRGLVPQPSPGTAPAAALQTELVRMIGARNDTAEVNELIASLETAPRKAPLIQALATGLKRAGTTLEKVDAGKKLTAVFTLAAASASDTSAPLDARLEALALLEAAPPAQAESALIACLGAGQPAALQTAAVQVLARSPQKDVASTLLSHWGHASPEARQAILTALIARPDRTRALLTAMQAGGPDPVKPGDLSAAQVQAILKMEDKEVATLARETLASVIPPSRETVIAKFQPALTLRGDIAKGQMIYLQRCFACHRAAGQGMEVGPDLITVKTKGRDALLSAILDPHKEVAPQFIAYTVSTRDGQVLSGIITQDDAASLTLKTMGGAQMKLPRASIKGTSSTSQSLMPEGLETGLTPQDLADLLDFIEGLK